MLCRDHLERQYEVRTQPSAPRQRAQRHDRCPRRRACGRARGKCSHRRAVPVVIHHRGDVVDVVVALDRARPVVLRAELRMKRVHAGVDDIDEHPQASRVLQLGSAAAAARCRALALAAEPTIPRGSLQVRPPPLVHPIQRPRGRGRVLAGGRREQVVDGIAGLCLEAGGVMGVRQQRSASQVCVLAQCILVWSSRVIGCGVFVLDLGLLLGLLLDRVPGRWRRLCQGRGRGLGDGHGRRLGQSGGDGLGLGDGDRLGLGLGDGDGLGLGHEHG
mmetsp:Transcript_14096/g.58879  ORF Transcript_14096/g.58879 Transcript_14096/m.58879 type:complete len:274 (-) Transcript_14096:1248-2069(-)